MKTKIFVLSMVMAFAMAGLTACTMPGESGEPSATGSANIGVNTSALSQDDVTSVVVTVTAGDTDTDPDGFPVVLELDEDAYGAWSGTINGIPEGEDRLFTAVAYGPDDTNEPSDADSDPDILYEGSYTADILEGGTASVNILMSQSSAPIPFVNTAPVFTALVIDDGHIDTTESTGITAWAEDVEDDASLLDFWWSGSGTFNPDGDATTPASTGSPASTDWTYATSGIQTLQVSVRDTQDAVATLGFEIEVYGLGSADISITMNSAPEIEGLIADPTRLIPGYVTALDLTASDPEGSTLSYSWEVTGCAGSFGSWTPSDGGGTLVTNATLEDPYFYLETEGTEDTCTLTVTVSDDADPSIQGTNTASITIHTGEPDWDADYLNEDDDGDGFVGADDCDDTNENINPDAVEICDDGIDNDCDKDIDAADAYCTS